MFAVNEAIDKRGQTGCAGYDDNAVPLPVKAGSAIFGNVGGVVA